MQNFPGSIRLMLAGTLALAMTSACSEDAASDSGTTDVEDTGVADVTGEGDDFDLRTLHDAFWVITVTDPESGITIESVADLHVDLETGRFTIYAQTRTSGSNGVVVNPPQLGVAECGDDPLTGNYVCGHLNAVYLNGSGQELYVDDGTGAWWVRHSWVDNGAPYLNCPLTSQEFYQCVNTTGTIQEDGLTLILDAQGLDNFNERVPMIDQDPITYRLIENNPEPQPALFYECRQEASALDNEIRPCPSLPK